MVKVLPRGAAGRRDRAERGVVRPSVRGPDATAIHLGDVTHNALLEATGTFSAGFVLARSTTRVCGRWSWAWWPGISCRRAGRARGGRPVWRRAWFDTCRRLTLAARRYPSTIWRTPRWLRRWPATISSPAKLVGRNSASRRQVGADGLGDLGSEEDPGDRGTCHGVRWPGSSTVGTLT